MLSLSLPSGAHSMRDVWRERPADHTRVLHPWMAVTGPSWLTLPLAIVKPSASRLPALREVLWHNTTPDAFVTNGTIAAIYAGA